MVNVLVEIPSRDIGYNSIKMNSVKIFLLSCIFLFLLASNNIYEINDHNHNLSNKNSWEYCLNEMNYLVLRTSSINIIQGLFLTPEQARQLKELAKKIESLNLSIPDTEGNTIDEFVKTRELFITIEKYLIQNKPISDSLKNEVFLTRKNETDIIKKTLIGADRRGLKGECMVCHAPPEYFSKGDVSKLETKKINEKKRKEIDVAHVKGIYNDEGIQMLWELKSEVDRILTNGQKYILNGFRCCLLPPDNLSDPSNIGQAFVTNEWINYFEEVRGASQEDWNNYKQLYFYPIEDIIEATLPGIKKKNKTEMMKQVEKIIESSRKMDKIDFELQKENICLSLQEALKVDFLIGETTRQKEDRQFIAAMFLLFPGSVDLYDEIITKSTQ